jgi:hypothetical protein
MPYYVPNDTVIYEIAEPVPSLHSASYTVRILDHKFVDKTVPPGSRLQQPGDNISILPLSTYEDGKIIIKDIFEDHPFVARDLPTALQKLNFLRQRRRENVLAKIEIFQQDAERLKKPICMNALYPAPSIYEPIKVTQKESYTSPFTGKTQ